jgi:hypothetical protein
MPRGGSRAGAGRKARYKVGTQWVHLPLPRDFAEGVSRNAAKLVRRLLKRLRRGRGDLPWDGRRSEDKARQ